MWPKYSEKKPIQEKPSVVSAHTLVASGTVPSFSLILHNHEYCNRRHSLLTEFKTAANIQAQILPEVT